MKLLVIIVFWGTEIISSSWSAVLPLSKHPTRTAENKPDEKTAGGLIEATASFQSISLESSSNVLRSTTVVHVPNDSETPDWHKFLDFDSKFPSSISKDSSLSKKHLHSSKFRIRHHPTYLVPIDGKPSRPLSSNYFKASSVAVHQIAATPLSSTSYQSVINLKSNLESENFIQIISSISSSKQKKSKDSDGAVHGKSIVHASEVLPKTVGKILPRQLTTIFTIANPAESPILSCHKPEAVVSIKCLSNFARLAFLFDELSNAKISLLATKESMKLSHVLYIHWWNESGSLETSINNILTVDQLRSTCRSCRNLHANLLLHEGGQGCVLPVTCNLPDSGKVKVDESYKTSVNLIESGLPVISTSLSFLGKEGEERIQDGDRVKSGQQVSTSIAGISETFPVGLFVIECHITIDNGPAVPLLSNGCSISNLLENFNLTSKKVNSIEVSSLISRFTAFNSEKISQQLIFSCRIMVCERKCGSHSVCQPHLTNYSQNSKSRNIFEVTLSKTIVIDPEDPVEREGRETELLQEFEIEYEYENADFVDSRPTPENFISIKMFYSTIFILSCVYTIVLLFCVLCMKYYLSRPKVYMNEMGDSEITTPERCLLNMDHGSARRRSPTSTIIYD